jgi:hypothetical protein
MDADGFKRWLKTTGLKPKTQYNALVICREIETHIGDLDKVVCDRCKMAEALSWLKDHPDRYVLRGFLKPEGAASRMWALRKYAKFSRPSRSMSAKAGS